MHLRLPPNTGSSRTLGEAPRTGNGAQAQFARMCNNSYGVSPPVPPTCITEWRAAIPYGDATRSAKPLGGSKRINGRHPGEIFAIEATWNKAKESRQFRLCQPVCTPQQNELNHAEIEATDGQIDDETK
jgi:hypothetical protein